MESHLLQMRGLKQRYLRNRLHRCYVASFTDAWIETLIIIYAQNYGKVASFTDAWIETLRYLACGEYGSVASLQMRGLKLCVADVAF